MNELPGVIFLVDPKKEKIAILEAKKLGIPVVGLVDTNCNPEELDYPIPGNDDAIRAVKLIADVMANAVIEGKQGESFEAEEANSRSWRRKHRRSCIKRRIINQTIKEEWSFSALLFIFYKKEKANEYC